MRSWHKIINDLNFRTLHNCRVSALKTMQNENLSSEEAYRTLAIIWFALFMSQFVFLVVIYFSKPELLKFDFTEPFLGENAVVIILLAFLAISNLIISFFLSKRFINEAIEKQSIAFVQRAMVVGLALCESISLFGLVLAFVFNYQYFFVWIAVGILGMLFHFPKRENIHLANYKKSQEF